MLIEMRTGINFVLLDVHDMMDVHDLMNTKGASQSERHREGHANFELSS